MEVAAGLRRGGLLNKAPSTLVLMNDGLIGFAAKTKTRGKSEGRPCGGSAFAYSKENADRLQKGYELFKKECGDYDRDFLDRSTFGV